MAKSSDDQKRDEILRRMLNTPHKAHPKAHSAKKAAKKKKPTKK